MTNYAEALEDTYVRGQKTAQVIEVSKEVVFGVDSKGRTVGAQIERTAAVVRSERRKTSEWSSIGYEVEIPVGEAFAVRGQATRGGIGFGASQKWNFFATEAEVQNYITKYLKGAEARARKNVVAPAPIDFGC